MELQSSPNAKSSYFLALLKGVSGGLAGITTDCIFYGIDSYKVLQQSTQIPSKSGSVTLSRLFRGMLPMATLGSGTSFFIFFGSYDYLKDLLPLYLSSSKPSSFSSSSTILMASLLAAIPSSLIAVPADVLKKRLILTNQHQQSSSSSQYISRSIKSLAMQIYREEGIIRGLFLGWQMNLMKDIPFAVLKMSLYEMCIKVYLYFSNNNSQISKEKRIRTVQSLTAMEIGVIGGVSGVLTAICTNPLDVVNTRIKSGELKQHGMLSASREVVKIDGIKALFRGLPARMIIIGCGSTVFWSLYGLYQKRLIPSHLQLGNISQH